MGTTIIPVLLLLMSPPVMHAPDLNAAMEARAAEVKARAAIETMAVSMLVTGTIEVDQHGGVERFELDQRDKLPESVDRLLTKAVPAWRFEPTLADGLPVAVRAPMRVRVVATRASEDPDSLLVRVGSASFGAAGEGGLPSSMPEMPRYPAKLLRMGVQGTVYLLAKVDHRDGTVEEVVAEQVNLRVVAGENDMQWMRARLARAAVDAVRTWTFRPPASGDAARGPFLVARVPFDFELGGLPQSGYGEWSVYVPGPRKVPDWASGDTAGGADTFVHIGVYPVDKGLKLLTPLGG